MMIFWWCSSRNDDFLMFKSKCPCQKGLFPNIYRQIEEKVKEQETNECGFGNRQTFSAALQSVENLPINCDLTLWWNEDHDKTHPIANSSEVQKKIWQAASVWLKRNKPIEISTASSVNVNCFFVFPLFLLNDSNSMWSSLLCLFFSSPVTRGMAKMKTNALRWKPLSPWVWKQVRPSGLLKFVVFRLEKE